MPRPSIESTYRIRHHNRRSAYYGEPLGSDGVKLIVFRNAVFQAFDVQSIVDEGRSDGLIAVALRDNKVHYVEPMPADAE